MFECFLAAVLAATAVRLCSHLDFLFVKILTAARHLRSTKLSFQLFCKFPSGNDLAEAVGHPDSDASHLVNSLVSKRMLIN